MRQISFIALVGVLSLWLAGCDRSPGGDQVTVDPVAPATTPEATQGTPDTVVVTPPGDPLASPDTAQQVPFSPPSVIGQAPPAGNLPPDLIGSTDPNQRVAAVQSNRPDPFALLPTTPTVQLPPVPEAQQTVPTLPTLPQPGGLGATPSGVVQPNGIVQPGGSVAAQPQPGSLAPIPQLVPSNPALPPLPPPPPPTDLARAVEVTGVVQIGSTLHAIVSAPNEPTSRYVRVGQRLSNGQVLVKRIEMTQGVEPVVILEQNGIEIVRAVGAGGETDAPAAAAISSPQQLARG